MKSKIKKLNALKEQGAKSDWFYAVPDKIKEDIKAALVESNNGDVIPHKEIKKWMLSHPL